MEVYSSKETTLRDYLRVLFRHKAIIITTLISVVTTVFIGLELKTPVYVANVKMLISAQKEIETKYYRGIYSGSKPLVSTHIEMVKSKLVIERVVKALGLYQRPLDYEKNFSTRLKAFLIDRRLKKRKIGLEKMTPEQKRALFFNMAMGSLTGSISATPLKDTNIFMISVRDFSPVVAAIIANSVSRSYVIFDLEQQVAELQLKYGEKYSTVLQLRDYIEKLYKSLDGKPLSSIEAIGPATVKIISQAQIGVPVRIVGRRLGLIFAFFTSMFLGVMLAFVFDYLDQTLKSPQDIETFFHIPFLGSIPKRKSKDKLLISDANPLPTKYTQSFQNLSDQMYLLMKDKNLKSLLITDAEGSEETTAIIANLAIYSSCKRGHRVLIIDANLRNPLVSKIFKIPNNNGLNHVLKEKIPFEDAIQDLGSHLHVLPAGEAVFNPITLLDSSVMSDVIKKAKEQYEIVFINCIDLNKFSDAVILSSIADGTVVIINEGKVKRQVVKSAIAPLEQKKINMVGVILNNRTYVIPKIIYDLT